MIQQKLQQIKQGKLTAEENIKNFINKIKKENPSLNIVLHLNEKAIEQAKEIDKKIKQNKAGKLAGIGFLVKSNINVQGLITNCASKTLKNYKAPYNATVINKLLKEDAIVLGMTNCDEFACGSTGENSAFGVCKNPAAPRRIPGGSSSGSGAAIAANLCDFALGSDTGGSVRAPASCCGVVGFKPSYGSVSRYGLVDMCMSFDVIGPLTKNTSDSKTIFNIIKGKDENDAISRDFSTNHPKQKLRIGITKINADKEIWNKIKEKVKQTCKKNNWIFEDIEIKNINLGIQTYYPIVYTEFFSGTRKFDGRKYGFKIEDTCGEEVLRRILGGNEITKAEYGGRYYRKALQARKILQKEFEKAFRKYNVLIMPTFPKPPHKIGEKVSLEDIYYYDACTVLANLCELPAISIPCGKIKDQNEDVPVGLQILGNIGSDLNLLDIAEKFEN